MKKNILIIVFVIVSLFLMMFAFIKADEADKSAMEAEFQRQKVEKLREEATQLQQVALEAEAEAQRQIKLAEKALADCQSK